MRLVAHKQQAQAERTTLSTFEHRLDAALQHEDAVALALERLGYTVTHFGQGQLSEAAREVLKAHDNPIRWMPDLLAVNLRHAVMVDAKFTAGRNYAIQTKAHEAHYSMAIALGTPVVYVWGDMHANTWYQVDQYADQYLGTPANGSGTPFKLLRTAYGQALDLVLHNLTPKEQT